MTSQILTNQVVEKSVFLRRVLLANAVFSASSGLAFIVFFKSISHFLGWTALWPLPLIGLGLLAFAVQIYRTARANRFNQATARAIFWADLIWVLASVVVLIGGWVPLSLGGKWGVGIVADIVGMFALLEVLGLRRLGK